MPEPTLPAEEDIAKLPRWARVAFAARCARRVMPLLVNRCPSAPREYVEAVERAIGLAEYTASTGKTTFTRSAYDAAYNAAAYVPLATGADPANLDTDPAVSVARAVRGAVYAARAAAFDDASETRASVYAARAAARAGPQHDITSILADFEAVTLAASQGNWTDATPVPLTVFEPIGEPDIRAVWQKRSDEVRAETPVDEDALKALLTWQERLKEIEAAAPPRALQKVRAEEDLAMQKQYPGEYVAFTESKSTMQRTVLAHDRHIKAVHDALAHLTEAEWANVRVTYCYPLARPFRGGYKRPKLVARTRTEPPAGA